MSGQRRTYGVVHNRADEFYAEIMRWDPDSPFSDGGAAQLLLERLQRALRARVIDLHDPLAEVTIPIDGFTKWERSTRWRQTCAKCGEYIERGDTVWWHPAPKQKKVRNHYRSDRPEDVFCGACGDELIAQGRLRLRAHRSVEERRAERGVAS